MGKETLGSIIIVEQKTPKLTSMIHLVASSYINGSCKRF